MLKLNILNKKLHLVSLIVLIHLTFSYYYFTWFYSSAIGTIGIVFLAWLTWKKEYSFWIGLQIKTSEILQILFAFIVFLLGSYFLVKVVAEPKEIQLYPGNYKNFLHTLFYTLNEEIILGALLLKGIRYYFKKLPDWQISVGVAIIFSIIHFVFFKWIFINTGNLGIFTLLSLVAVGIARNNLILRTGHIGYSWALHFGWIYIMLGSMHYNLLSEQYLTDFERFEFYLGDFRILGVCIALAIASFMVFKKSTSSE